MPTQIQQPVLQKQALSPSKAQCKWSRSASSLSSCINFKSFYHHYQGSQNLPNRLETGSCYPAPVPEAGYCVKVIELLFGGGAATDNTTSELDSTVVMTDVTA